MHRVMSPTSSKPHIPPSKIIPEYHPTGTRRVSQHRGSSMVQWCVKKWSTQAVNPPSLDHISWFIIWLVWNMAFMTFHIFTDILGISWNFITPTDEVHHFSEGVGQPPTSHHVPPEKKLPEMAIRCWNPALFSCEAKVARRTWWTFNQCTWGFMIQQSKNDLDIWKCLLSSNGFEPKYNFMCGFQICSMPPTSSWRMQASSNQDRSCILTYAGKWFNV